MWWRTRGAGSVADILMYHAIASDPGPTSIAPEVFAAQMQALAVSGRPVVTLDQYLATGDPRAVVITFDDAFVDFADRAWPVLRRHGFPAQVYVPTAHVGGTENWAGGHVPPRPVLPWAALRDLAAEGVSLGGHSRRHPDLTTLDGAALRDEVAGARAELEDRIGRPCPHFAPPYGASNPRVRAVIRDHCASSVGVRLGQAAGGDDRFDLPRIEMYYFRDIRRWRAHLAGRGRSYLFARQTLRALRRRLKA